MAVVRPPLGLVLSWLPHGSVKMDFMFGVYRQVTWKKQIRIISPDVRVLIGVLIQSMGLFVVLCVCACKMGLLVKCEWRRQLPRPQLNRQLNARSL